MPAKKKFQLEVISKQMENYTVIAVEVDFSIGHCSGNLLMCFAWLDKSNSRKVSIKQIM